MVDFETLNRLLISMVGIFSDEHAGEPTLLAQPAGDSESNEIRVATPPQGGGWSLSFLFDCFGLGFSATCFDGDLYGTFHRIFEGHLDSE
jgi:hypothetical protein